MSRDLLLSGGKESDDKQILRGIESARYEVSCMSLANRVDIGDKIHHLGPKLYELITHHEQILTR